MGGVQLTDLLEHSICKLIWVLWNPFVQWQHRQETPKSGPPATSYERR